MLPTFIVIGAMKSGTTSLFRYLREHPQVFMPQAKELNFFIAKKNWGRGLPWYESQFADVRGETAVGEASPCYAMHPIFEDVPAHMAKVVPDARLIYVLRHPIERMRSHYLHLASQDRERAPLASALLENPHYLNVSQYAMQIERYLDHFPSEQLLIVESSDLREARVETMRRIHEFVGVNPDWVGPSADREFHLTAQKRMYRRMVGDLRRTRPATVLRRLTPLRIKQAAHRIGTRAVDQEGEAIPEGVRLRLEDALRDDVERLRAHVGQGFDGWGIG